MIIKGVSQQIYLNFPDNQYHHLWNIHPDIKYKNVK